MTSVAVGGVTFEDGAAQWILERDGLGGWFDGAPVRGDDRPRPTAHGSFGERAWRGGRIVSVNVAVRCSSPAAAESARDVLAGILADGRFGDLTVTSDAGRVTSALVRLNAKPLIDWTPWSNTVRAQLEFFAPDPFRYGPTVRRSTGFPQDMSGLRFPLFTDGGSGDPTVWTNLVVNPAGAASGTAWVGSTGVTVMSEGPPLGPFATSVRATRAGTGAGQIAGAATILPSTTYTARLRLRASAPVSAVVYLRPGGGSTGQTTMGTVAVPADETEVTLTATSGTTAPTSASRLAVVLGSGQGAVGVTLDVVATLVQGTADPGGIWSGSGGSLADVSYAWTGAAAASPSTATPAPDVTGVLMFGDPGNQTGTVALTNDGTAEAWPQFVAHGPVPDAGFEVLEVETGRLLRYVGGVGPGLALTIDPAEGVVLLGGQDRLTNLRVRQWSAVPPGATRSYLFRSLGGHSAAVLDVELASTYW